MIQASKPLIGIGLRPPHYEAACQQALNIDWLEVHSENFLIAGGPLLDQLLQIREHYPISLHGVGLSLGSAEGIDAQHLKRLKQLIERVDPFLVSEHLSWSQVDGHYLPDLLPVPYHQHSLLQISDNVKKAQDVLGKALLIENPSSYFEYHDSQMSEAAFLTQLCEKTGAKILLDLNNVIVSCHNHQWDTEAYLAGILTDLIAEIHLAGHSVKKLDDGTVIKVDTHDNFVCDAVWDLYEKIAAVTSSVPTLLEWDSNIPAADVLIQEAQKVLHYQSNCHADFA